MAKKWKKHHNWQTRFPNYVYYYSTRRTSAMWNISAGYWAIGYCVIHAKYTAERMHDACVFTTHHSRPNKHLCFAVPKFFSLNYNLPSKQQQANSKKKTNFCKCWVLLLVHYWKLAVLSSPFLSLLPITPCIIAFTTGAGTITTATRTRWTAAGTIWLKPRWLG